MAEQRAGSPADPDREVLRAPLVLPGRSWTSHSVAEHLGLSQSQVARTWRRAYATTPAAAWQVVGPRTLALVGLAVTRRGSALALGSGGPRPGAGSTTTGAAWMRRPTRPHLQAVLAADLVDVPTDGPDSDRTPPAHLLREALGADAWARSLVVTQEHLGDVEGPAPGELVVVPREQWQGQLVDLVARQHTAHDGLAEAHAHVRRWARSPAEPLVWVHAGTPRVGARTGSGRGSGDGPATVLTTAYAAAAAMCDEISARGLGPQHAFSVSHLATRLHSPRSETRAALQLLAADGLVDLDRRGAARVPVPTTADVVETYAARRAIGSLVVARLARSSATRTRLERLLRDLETAVAAVAAGSTATAGFADLDFQDGLAELADLRRLPTMFRRLTIQLRLFITVLGLAYEFSPTRIVADGTDLVEALVHGDAAAAVSTWQRKIDSAVDYMLGSLATVDLDLS